MASTPIEARLKHLETHLERENPVLLDVVKTFRLLDRVARAMGLISKDESYATRVPWWPLISVLGTFSSGKSTFINAYVGGNKLQQTGNQAVDDKFTVICFSSDETPRTLPGLALDADPRFPFYQISEDIEEVAAGEGRRVDAYLQLKTTPAEHLRGKIIIDSPGFDADAQRTSTLRITDHIIDLSDLVLVFFDARHPEPGAMQDTLEHLVANTISRDDSNKFLYILNQIDTAAREDNPEEVFAAWQRALASKGLTAGRFFRVYDKDAAAPIDDPALRERFESKRDTDMEEIRRRMQQVEVERAYRIIGVLERTARDIQDTVVPRLNRINVRWKKTVLWLDGIVFGLAAIALVVYSLTHEWWQGLHFNPPWLEKFSAEPLISLAVAICLVLAITYVHHLLRNAAAAWVRSRLHKDPKLTDSLEAILKAFHKNTRPWRSIFKSGPTGWTGFSRRKIAKVLTEADTFVQKLNDRFTNPSGAGGEQGDSNQAEPPAAVDSASAPPPPTTMQEPEDNAPAPIGIASGT